MSHATSNEHKAFSAKLQLPIRLLADPDREITRAYGRHWLYPINFTRAVVVIDADGIIRTRNIMLRAFRPSDDQIITDIYEARGDALKDKYDQLRKRISNVKSG